MPFSLLFAAGNLCTREIIDAICVPSFFKRGEMGEGLRLNGFSDSGVPPGGERFQNFRIQKGRIAQNGKR